MEFDDVQRIIKEEGDFAVRMLQGKNAKYGNSAIAPKRFFSKADSLEQIKVRIDDKLNRLLSGLTDEDEEDVVLDLIGYLILLRVAKRVQTEDLKAVLKPKEPNTTLIGPGSKPGCFPGQLPDQGPIFKHFVEDSYK